MPDPWQSNTDRTYSGRWSITFSNPPINMFVPATIVELGALMTDLEPVQAEGECKMVERRGGDRQRSGAVDLLSPRL